jgi:hypothetical protein
MAVVTAMLNSNGNAVKNQFVIIEDDGSVVFQSYKTRIARIAKDGTVVLDPEHDCSKTTARYRNLFLKQTSAQVWACIKDGTYKIEELN